MYVLILFFISIHVFFILKELSNCDWRTKEIVIS